jgi:Tol biopolymer transport system component
VWDVFPQWSPDGQLISFYRPPEIIVIPAIGGREAKLGEIKFGGIGHVQTWSGDSTGVIVADRDLGAAGSLSFLPLDMSGRSRITEPPAGSGDLTPAMSPDGRMLAFTRNNASLANNIFLLPMDGHRPAGPEQQLTFEKSTTYFYLTWAEDGKSLFCLRSRPDPAVIRVSINKNEPIEIVPQILPSITSFLAAAPRGNRLAWSTTIYDMDLWRTELSVAGAEQRRRHTRIAHTMRPEQEAALSPDGSMLAFMSGRGGTNQLWLSDADGNNAIVFDPRKAHHPSWSPDGKQIAYELFDRGGMDIYVKPVRYGAGRRVTEEPSLAMRPAWSRNGRWIYFSSNRSGLRDIWKVPAEGGAMVRVTQKGGLRAAESTDGQTIYFTKEDSEWAVWAIPVKGGSETRILGGLLSGDGFHVSTEGIYAVMKNAPKGGTSLVRYSFRSGQVDPIEALDGRFHQSISMSADARWLVYDALRYRSGDLMMIEGLQ